MGGESGVKVSESGGKKVRAGRSFINLHSAVMTSVVVAAGGPTVHSVRVQASTEDKLLCTEFYYVK